MNLARLVLVIQNRLEHKLLLQTQLLVKIYQIHLVMIKHNLLVVVAHIFVLHCMKWVT